MTDRLDEMREQLLARASTLSETDLDVLLALILAAVATLAASGTLIVAIAILAAWLARL